MSRPFKAFLRFLFPFSYARSRKGSASWDSLFRKIGHRFHDESLLRQALTHRSFTHHNRPSSNERLEFLGDAVLGFIVTDELYRRFPESSEGELTKAKSIVVSRESLAHQARAMDLGDYILLSRGEERSGGRLRRSILSNTYEALLGALYLDGGLERVRFVVRRDLMQNIERFFKDRIDQNSKSWLLEYAQGRAMGTPEYRVLHETGPDHEKQFFVEVAIRGRVMGKGMGLSKKTAEKAAALDAIRRMGLTDKEFQE
ncbi:ribonuclease III [bacterium]|nr:ribonuclease III [bacterium]